MEVSRRLACAAITALVSAALVVAPAQPAHAEVVCSVSYQRSWDNGSAFGAAITIRNLGDPLNGWTLTFTFPGNQRIENGWYAGWRQDGPNVTGTSQPWNGSVGTGASLTLGFNATYTGANTDPSNFALNGVPCNGTPRPPSVVVTPTSVLVPEGGSATLGVRLSSPPASNMTVMSTAGAGDPDLTICAGGTLVFTPVNWSTTQLVRICAVVDADRTNGSRVFNIGGTSVTATEVENEPAPVKVDNPFAGAAGYVNPDWRGQVEAQAATTAEPLAGQMRAVGQQPTAVWLDRIGSITAGRGLAGHLDAAVAQDAANGAAPTVVTLVLYNLPNRNCQAPEGSSELTLQGGLTRYQTEYVDAIGTILARPEYAALRVAIVVEPQSLYSHVVFEPPTQYTTFRCYETHRSNVYRDGIRYAIGRLSALPNTYLYVDIAGSNWMGWDQNIDIAVGVYDNVIAAASGGPGYDKIHGFATNVAGYVPLEEIFLPDPRLMVSGQPIIQTRWFDWSTRIDEHDYVTYLATAFAAKGCTGCGILIDTSRNGWGGPDRPVRVSTSTDPNRYVNESRLDRRLHRINTCNQVGAGIGVRPTADTGIAGVDAFVWAKPPGESDGTGSPSTIDPDDPHKLFDPMCDPLMRSRYEDEVATGAMPGGPHLGRWFPAQFEVLVRHAHPPIG